MIKQKDLKFAVLSTDVAIFTIKDGAVFVRLQKVSRPPHFDCIPGLPGGLISPTETAEDAVRRIVTEKAGLESSNLYIEQLYTFSDIERDPRGRVVSVAYISLIPWEQLNDSEKLDAEDAYWKRVDSVRKLAYDHNKILIAAYKRLQSRVVYTTVSSKLLPKEFTFTQLEKIHETILEKEIDKRNFRKKMLGLNIIKKTIKKVEGLKHRPASLYTFASTKVTEINTI